MFELRLLFLDTISALRYSAVQYTSVWWQLILVFLSDRLPSCCMVACSNWYYIYDRPLNDDYLTCSKSHRITRDR